MKVRLDLTERQIDVLLRELYDGSTNDPEVADLFGIIAQRKNEAVERFKYRNRLRKR